MAITSDITTEPPPDRALFIGARLFVAGDAFFFLGFLFAYLYLRALNSNGLWHPPHTNPSGALATVSLVAVVAAAVIVRVADDRRAQMAAAAATVLVLVAAVCEGVQLFDPGFSPIHAAATAPCSSASRPASPCTCWVPPTGSRRSPPTAPPRSACGCANCGRRVVFVTFLAAVAVIATVLFYLV